MWKNIIGHQTIKKTLINALTNNKVAHAYLLTGPRGLGKDTIARTFAQSFFCSGKEGNPCHTCSTCKKILTENYPDLHIIEPAGSTIKIEQIREIQKMCQYKPYEGLGKVFIIKNAEAMTVEAANCLLKVLEEPTQNTLFILTAENPYNLLPTVLSRCQKLNLQPVPTAEIAQWLESKGVDFGRARVLSSLSDGIPAKAISLMAEEGPGQRKVIAGKVEQILQGDVLAVLRVAEEMDGNKEAVLDDLDLMIVWYRDLIVWLTTREEGLIINIDLIDQIEKQAAQLSAAKVQKDLDDIMQTRKNLRANANLRLSLENLLLKLSKSA